MAGAFIELDDAEVHAALEKLLAKLGDLEPVFRDLGESLLISHRARFERGVSPDGVPWPDLSPATLARKPKNRDKILVLDGWLRQLNYAAGKTELRLGTDRVYGATHQFGARKGAFGKTRRGAPIPWGDIPPRPFLGLDEAERAEILATLADWLSDI